jgi:D-psicose/D-tagatose/L-ribulose 3-epimerase
LRLAICNELFEGWPLAEAFRFVAGVGYEAVEIAPYTLGGTPDELSARRRAEIRALAGDNGLAITGLHWLLAGARGVHAAAADAETSRRTLAYLRELTELCADLGGRVLVFGSPAQRSTPAGTDPAAARGRIADTLRAWSGAASDCGVTICLEALPAAETDQITTTAEAVAMVEEIGSPALRLVLDVKSMSADGTPIPDQIRLAAPHLAYVQANDASRRGPGLGDTDFVPILRALAGVGYRGDVSVEALDRGPDPVTVARTGYACLRSALRALAPAEQRAAADHMTEGT